MQKVAALFLCFFILSCGDSVKKKEYKSPEIEYGDLFVMVQKQKIFNDAKVFADAIPKVSVEEVKKEFDLNKSKKGFDLKAFVVAKFDIPNYEVAVVRQKESLEGYLNKTMLSLIREPKDDGGSLVPTRKRYVSGGTKFEEFNYWRSYFALKGLLSISKDSIASEVAVNCAQFIQDFGHVPSGNRSYMLSGSQMPVFSLMVKEMNNKEMLGSYATSLTKEYQYWMAAESKEEAQKQTEAMTSKKKAFKKVVFLSGKNLLNRYYNETNSPRAEYYLEDLKRRNYVETRTAEESGWGESSRWTNKGIVEASSFMPVDLNAMLYFMETTLSEIYQLKGKKEYAASFYELAKKRKSIFDKYFWNEAKGFYFDYNFVKNAQSEVFSLAGVYPLFLGLASQKQADLVAAKLEKSFLKNGGLLNTLSETGSVWDAPFGSAQMQYVAIVGLKKYKKYELAEKIRMRWQLTNQQYYNATGRILENYNVVDIQKNLTDVMKTKNERLDAAVGVLLSIQRP